MYRIPIAWFLAIVFWTSLLTGCESLSSEKMFGGLLGGATGAAVGGAVGGKEGAMIGAAAGLVAGVAIGHYLEKKDEDRTQAVAAVGYRSEQGSFMEIKSAKATPEGASRGDTVNIDLQYTVITPDNERSLIKETREVRYNGNPVAREVKETKREDGTYTVTLIYQVPEDSRAGTYQVVNTVEMGDKRSETFTSFTVNE